MGMFDWVRKKKVSPKVERRDIAFGDIGKWIDSCGGDLGEHEKELLAAIKEKLDGFHVSLGEKLDVLKAIDIEAKNEHGRAKVLVRQGLDKYVNFVHILLKELGNIKMKDLDKVIKKIGDEFANFEKNSAKGYERATYLVGDEMGAVRNEVRGFYNGLVKMFDGDKSSIRDLNRLGNVRLKMKEFKDGEKSAGDIKKEIEMKSRDIGKAKARVEELNSEVEKIRLSSEYVANVKMGESIKVLRVNIESEISSLSLRA
jgi:hypothetical protein